MDDNNNDIDYEGVCYGVIRIILIYALSAGDWIDSNSIPNSWKKNELMCYGFDELQQKEHSMLPHRKFTDGG